VLDLKPEELLSHKVAALALDYDGVLAPMVLQSQCRRSLSGWKSAARLWGRGEW